MSQDPPRAPAADEPTSDGDAPASGGDAPPQEAEPAEPAASAPVASAATADASIASSASSSAPLASAPLASAPPPKVELPPLPKHTPWVTIALAAANIVVWFVTVALGASVISPSSESLFEHGGNLGAITLDGEEWRLFTSMFLHIGVLHLAMNMAGLIIGGRVIERLFGHLGFAAIYLISGLAGSLATALRPGVVSAGASGAIFGVLGALGAYYVIHRDRMDPRIAKQSTGLLVVVAYNVINGFADTSVDVYAHLGGLGAGFLCGFAMELGRRERSLPRTLAVTVVGLAAVIAGALAAPAPFDENLVAAQQERRAVQAALDAEKQVLERWAELLDQVRQDALTVVQFAEGLERDVVVPWRAATVAFEESGASCPMCPHLRTYMRARVTAFEVVLQGARDDDEATIERGVQQLIDAEQVLKRAVEP